MAFNFPHPLPNGWFHLAYADELARGTVKTVRAFGQDLVLFRTETIWENNKYLVRPLLCDGDGPIQQARDLMQESYSPAGAA
jgi:hypothetical protein